MKEFAASLRERSGRQIAGDYRIMWKSLQYVTPDHFHRSPFQFPDNSLIYVDQLEIPIRK